MTPILRIENVSFNFGAIKAVNNVSMAISKGEVVALIGPNGAGKTTLLNLISGLLNPLSGKIIFRGRLINDFKTYEISQMGLARTFQEGSSFLNLSVYDNLLVSKKYGYLENPVIYLLKFRKYKKIEMNDIKNLTETLEYFGLSKIKDLETKKLSFGQIKLLEIIRIMVQNPNLALLDEPFAGVSPYVVDHIHKAIVKMKEKGTSFLIVDHRIHYLFPLVDRVVVMAKGEIIAEGLPETIHLNPKVAKAYFSES